MTALRFFFILPRMGAAKPPRLCVIFFFDFAVDCQLSTVSSQFVIPSAAEGPAFLRQPANLPTFR
jgi:hypothetical protein